VTRSAILVTLALLLLPASFALADPPLRIGRIWIHADDIYSESEAARGFAYSLADRLHAKTRPAVIREFLLFHEGDVYDPARLAESERNLRSLGFLRAVSVTAGPPHDGVVDVDVQTEDAWSLEPGTSAGSNGGVSTYGFQLKDSNLAGFGRQATVSFDRGTQRSRAAIDISDPAFFRPYRKARLTYAQNSDGFEHRLAIGTPFYSFLTPRSNELSFEEFRRTDHWYQDGRDTSQFQQRHRRFVAAFGLAPTRNENEAKRWTGGIRIVDDSFRPLAGIRSATLPNDRAFHYGFVRFQHAQNRFISRNFVDQDVRYQDFNLGRVWSAEAAISPRGSGGHRTSEFFATDIARGRQFGDDGFAIGRAAFETRVDDGLENAILSGSLRYVRQFDAALPQTFVARLVLDYGWRLDRDVQFFADGDSGLRGYRLFAFEGSRTLLLNFEQRLFLGRELLQIMSPGVVAFADVGKATNGFLLSPRGFKTDAGLGVRIGLPRAPRNTLRLDFAYAFQRDPLGRRGLLVSFSSGQAF